MRLSGLEITSNKKPYCTGIKNGVPWCADKLSSQGSLIRYYRERILTGDESWYYDVKSKCYGFYAEDKYFDEIDGGAQDPMLCTHYRWSNNIDSTPLYMFSGGWKNEIKFNYDNGIGGLNNYIAWVRKKYTEGEGVKLVYIMKNPIYQKLDWNSRERDKIFNRNLENLG